MRIGRSATTSVSCINWDLVHDTRVSVARNIAFACHPTASMLCSLTSPVLGFGLTDAWDLQLAHAMSPHDAGRIAGLGLHTVIGLLNSNERRVEEMIDQDDDAEVLWSCLAV